MRILLGYSYYKHEFDIKDIMIERAKYLSKNIGVQIEIFCLTLNPPGAPLKWKELHEKWKWGDNSLTNMYEELLRRINDYDVFLNWNGINIHPEILKNFSTINVFACFDDPESSEELSKPVASAYDLCLVGNIAEVEKYKEWGAKRTIFWPLGFWPEDYDETLTYDRIINGDRNVDIALLCERETSWRRERLDIYFSAFPDGKYYGKGWPKGFYPEKERVQLYQNTKIGPNFHNSSGPVNYRTYILPANGVMLLCDNKSNLGKIFRLGIEAVGFDTVEEAIELTHYYLAHDNERKKIAGEGWKRVVKEYNSLNLFKTAIDNITRIKKEKSNYDTSVFLNKRREELGFRKTAYNYIIKYFLYLIRRIVKLLKATLKVKEPLQRKS